MPPVLVRCPACGRPSDRIKSYRIVGILFLLIVSRISTRRVVACGRCMRSTIAESMAVNLLTANVVFPFVILPLDLVLLGLTALPGHSRFVQRQLE